MLNVGYCNQQANVRTFFDTGSHRSFISPEVVKRLNLRVIKQVPMGILPESFSPSERETISLVRSNMQKSELGYIVRLPFKDDTRPSVNYRTARGQLNHLVQRAENDEQFGQHYNKVVRSCVEKEFIE